MLEEVSCADWEAVALREDEWAVAAADEEAWLLVKEPATTLEVARAPVDAPWLMVSMRLKRRETELYKDVVGSARLDVIADDVAEGEAKRVFGIDPATELLVVDSIEVETTAVEAGMEDWLNTDLDDDDDTTTTGTGDDED